MVDAIIGLDFLGANSSVIDCGRRVLTRVAESQAGVRPVTGRPDSPGLPGRPARSDKLMLLINLLKIHG